MTKLFLFTLAFMLLAHVSLAGEETASWESVTIHTPKPERALAVTAASDGATLRSLVMEIDGAKLEVPAADLSALEKPRLNTIQIALGTLRNKIPYQSVIMDFGDPVMVDGEPAFPTATFLFQSGRYQSKNIIRVTHP